MVPAGVRKGAVLQHSATPEWQKNKKKLALHKELHFGRKIKQAIKEERRRKGYGEVRFVGE